MATPKKKGGRTTPAKKTPAPVSTDLIEIRFDPDKQPSPKQLDLLTAASGWTINDLTNGAGIPSGKMIAAQMWFAIRPQRPDITPEQIYESEDLAADFGIELQADRSRSADKLDPTPAAG